jgi:mRNA interferase RelE/StbE
MQTKFRQKFSKDITSIKDKAILKQIREVIIAVEEASSLHDLKNLKKLKGTSSAYRVKIGDSRLGFFLEQDTIEFTRFLHRKDIYKYFP